MKNDNYYVVQGWMINELELSGNHLQIYAIIHGFTQDGETWFTGGNKYLRELLKVSRKTVVNSLRFLSEKGLLDSQTDDKNNLSTMVYKTKRTPCVKFTQALGQNLHTDNNIIYIYTENDFLNDWKKARELFMGVPTHINNLTTYEKRDFNRLKAEFSDKDFKDGIKGLFKQKELYKSVKLRPTHFLQERNIEKYIDAYRNGIQLFESKKRENKL